MFVYGVVLLRALGGTSFHVVCTLKCLRSSESKAPTATPPACAATHRVASRPAISIAGMASHTTEPCGRRDPNMFLIVDRAALVALVLRHFLGLSIMSSVVLWPSAPSSLGFALIRLVFSLPFPLSVVFTLYWRSPPCTRSQLFVGMCAT